MSGAFNFNGQHPLSVLAMIVGTAGVVASRPRSIAERRAIGGASALGLLYVLVRTYLDPPQGIVELLPGPVVRLLGWPFITRCDDACPAPVETLAVAFFCLVAILVVVIRTGQKPRPS